MGSMYAELFEDDVAAPSGTKVMQARTESGTPLCPPKVENQGRAGGDGQVPEAEVEGQEVSHRWRNQVPKLQQKKKVKKFKFASWSSRLLQLIEKNTEAAEEEVSPTRFVLNVGNYTPSPVHGIRSGYYNGILWDWDPWMSPKYFRGNGGARHVTQISHTNLWDEGDEFTDP